MPFFARMRAEVAHINPALTSQSRLVLEDSDYLPFGQAPITAPSLLKPGVFFTPFTAVIRTGKLYDMQAPRGCLLNFISIN